LICFSDYITISQDTPSRSGLYYLNLPGVSLDLLDQLVRPDQADRDEFYTDTLYPNAINKLVSDVSKLIQDKFYLNLKLVSRETSEFQTTINIGSGLSGIKLKFNLPKYAKVHIMSVGVFSEQGYNSPDFSVSVYDTDENGEVLYTVGAELAEGRNTIYIDQDFEADELFIGYNPGSYELRKTANKYFQGCDYWDQVSCDFRSYWGRGFFSQHNGGGLNVKYNVYCSIEKFICENINLFKTALWWALGQETIIERRIGLGTNEYTAMTEERADQLMTFYLGEYQKEILNAVKAQSIKEDVICFNCKGVVNVQTNLP
jgi:hypothetical protein